MKVKACINYLINTGFNFTCKQYFSIQFKKLLIDKIRFNMVIIVNCVKTRLKYK